MATELPAFRETEHVSLIMDNGKAVEIDFYKENEAEFYLGLRDALDRCGMWRVDKSIVYCVKYAGTELTYVNTRKVIGHSEG